MTTIILKLGILSPSIYKNIPCKKANKINNVLNIKYNKKKNEYNTIERNSDFFFNNNLIFKTLFILLAFFQGMFLYMDGDRIPNFSIIVVMFMGYSILVNKDIFKQTYQTI